MFQVNQFNLCTEVYHICILYKSKSRYVTVKKRDSHLITYRSGNTATQIDSMLFRKSLRKLVMDVKVIPGEEVALQHQLLVCNMMIDMPPQIKRKFTPRPKVWKLRDPQT